jgi:hypothetical protein
LVSHLVWAQPGLEALPVARMVRGYVMKHHSDPGAVIRRIG